MKSIDICREIALLCKEFGASEYYRSFMYFADELESGDFNVTKRKIIGMYAGMGSFNDLVLHKNGAVLYSENDRLHKLKNYLYEDITSNW